MNKKNVNKNNFVNYEDIEIDDINSQFISSYFAWVPLQKQKDDVEKLEGLNKNN